MPDEFGVFHAALRLALIEPVDVGSRVAIGAQVRHKTSGQFVFDEAGAQGSFGGLDGGGIGGLVFEPRFTRARLALKLSRPSLTPTRI